MVDVAPSYYYLRIYPDRSVAQWPSPPDGGISWSRLKKNELDWNHPKNPRIFVKGDTMIMKSPTGSQTLVLLPQDLEPGQKAEQGAAANP